MSDLYAGRYRPVAPLPAIGGVQRELAVDQVADHRVAVARIEGGERAAAVGRYLRALQTCRQASLAPILNVVDEPPTAFVHVEAQADGPLLSSAIRLPQTSALLVGADVADALGALHDAGLAHGGLVADAIVLDASGRPVVMGAGLAGAAAAAAGLPSPIASDDLRALGAILYLLVTGHAPATPPASPASLAPDVPPAVNGLILALLSSEDRRPPPPAGPVAERLRALAGVQLPLELMPAPRPQPPLPMTPRRGISDAGLAAIVGGIALLAIILAVATVNGRELLNTGSTTGLKSDVPTFTLPAAESLTLTVTDQQLPLPDVLTDTVPTDTVSTDLVPTDTFEVFTDTTETSTEPVTATDIVTVTG